MSEILVNVTRGEYIESRHYGDIAIVDREGKLLYSVGDFDRFTFFRSAAKPFQVIPFIESGGIEKFNITLEELSVMTSSHNGEKEHVNMVNNILYKLNLTIQDLDCGTCVPMSKKASEDILKSQNNYTALHNACSGKHCAMLGLSILKNINIKDYISTNHPIQQEMLNIISQMCSIKKDDIAIAIDGCGVPVFGMGIDKMALAYARLSKPDGLFSKERCNSIKTIVSAMTKYPFYVAGTNRLDTILMQVTNGKVIAKLGAEAIYCVGIVDKGIGICIKIDDGSFRAIDPVIIEVLKQLNILSNTELSKLQFRHMPELKNHRKEVIGVLKPAFRLNRHI
ncbi:asparaginase [Alkalithermobacter thermoalcaliphilus JW-YL-7 = DSM 7308]|uniref:Asparaginase n=1 Tax=Alkalithermobacter thermoalcaliphilus JW-YL-7 = DSM 7308 TaxID=1121328 RepID=A0A150FQQ9_CLOPD|nr:L-asparaginase II [[Clostridium] paradoxum JW-YL-7 = DSM 7308]SHK77924.1 asparaginase [[Clostridium] paradoxum JW-YL-7 = DSM 7308]